MKRMNVYYVLLLIPSVVLGENQIQLKDTVTGAQSWEAKQHGVVLYLNQLLPDQLRAFYSNRGFSQKQINSYVQSCVFMTVLRNESAEGMVKYRLDTWSVKTSEEARTIKSTHAWLKQYSLDGVKKSAQIAFKWAQFPSEQEYEPGGDWNQGMLSLGAKTEQFDVIANWTQGENEFQIKMNGVTCAQ